MRAVSDLVVPTTSHMEILHLAFVGKYAGILSGSPIHHQYNFYNTMPLSGGMRETQLPSRTPTVRRCILLSANL